MCVFVREEEEGGKGKGGKEGKRREKEREGVKEGKRRGEGKRRKGKRGPGRSPGEIFKKCFLPRFQASWGPLVCVFGLLSPGSFCG